MALDLTCTDPMYLTGRLAALAEKGDDRLSTATVDQALVYPLKAFPTLLDRIHRFDHDELASGVIDLIPGGAMPAGPVGVEAQGPYWTGYYHQRGYPKHVRDLTYKDLDEAGRTLFGERWQTDMSRLLDYKTAARLREILRGDRPMAGGALADIVASLRQRSAEAAAVANRLEALLEVPNA